MNIGELCESRLDVVAKLGPQELKHVAIVYMLQHGGRVEVVEQNLDECVLCRLCIEASPPGTVRVKKLYDGSELS